MKKILLATSNPGKLREFLQIIKPHYSIQFVIKPIYQDIGKIPESGINYLDNALIKAKIVYQYYQCPVISDDSGLELINFNNIPGIYSARYAGINATDQQNRNKLKKFLLGNYLTSTPARYRCVLVYQKSINHIKNFEAVWNGNIVTSHNIDNGFGYDPMFIPIGYNQTVAEIDIESKNKYSHRAQAVMKFVKFLEDDF
ncbi:MAG: RdgB/HAM1 family non-canonical purine NTP pyrophosphatase [Candidatus Dasytiphilus stammeri]